MGQKQAQTVVGGLVYRETLRCTMRVRQWYRRQDRTVLDGRHIKCSQTGVCYKSLFSSLACSSFGILTDLRKPCVITQCLLSIEVDLNQNRPEYPASSARSSTHTRTGPERAYVGPEAENRIKGPS